jgi:mannose-1-phosphate guanylyltransferase/mannose-6-phosphate isomerase
MQASISVISVIMAGGSGTRLWLLSRAGYPKQFFVLSGTQSLFQQSVLRLQGLAGADITLTPPLVMGSDEHRFLVLEQLREIKCEPAAVLLEPVGRNTAPALQTLENGADPVLVVTPAGQTVTDAEAFTAAVQQAVRRAAGGNIIILGITPDRPETGYGYIHADGEALDNLAGAERLGFVISVDLWLQVRCLRNRMAREYVCDTAALQTGHGFVPLLLTAADTLHREVRLGFGET